MIRQGDIFPSEQRGKIEGLYTLSFKLDAATSELLYSFDNDTYKSTGVILKDGCKITGVEENDAEITIHIGDQSFTIVKPQEIEFEIRAGKVFFGKDETKTIKVKTAGIDHFTVVSAPRGWWAAINNDGQIVVTAPVDNSGANSGYIQIHACAADGECFIGKFMVGYTGAYTAKLTVAAYDGKLDITGFGGCYYYFGVSTRESFEADVDALMSKVHTALQNSDYNTLGAIQTSSTVADTDSDGNVLMSIADAYGKALEDGVEYVVWAFDEEDCYETYTIDNAVFCYYNTVTPAITVTEDESRKSIDDIFLNISVTGAESYRALAWTQIKEYNSTTSYESLLATKIEQVKEELAGGYGKVLTENYSGMASELGMGAYEAEPGSDVIVAVIPLDERPADKYSIENVVYHVFSTSGLEAGGTIAPTAERVFKFEQYGTQYVNPANSLGASINTTAAISEWQYYYRGWLTDAEWSTYGSSDKTLVDFICRTTMPVIPEYVETFPEYSIIEGIQEGTKMHFVTFFVDQNGKYGQLVKLEMSGISVENKQWLFPATLMTDLGIAEDGMTIRSLLDISATMEGYLTLAYSMEDMMPDEADYAGWWSGSPGWAGTYSVQPTDATSGTIVAKILSMMGERECKIPYSNLSVNECTFDLSEYLGVEGVYKSTLSESRLSVNIQ